MRYVAAGAQPSPARQCRGQEDFLTIPGPAPGPGPGPSSRPPARNGETAVQSHRARARAVLARSSDRILVITGPHSVQDPETARHARHLARLAAAFRGDLLIAMYCRHDPGPCRGPGTRASPRAAGSLPAARRTLLALAGHGMPSAWDLEDREALPYLHDMITWGLAVTPAPRAGHGRQRAPAPPASAVPVSADGPHGTPGPRLTLRPVTAFHAVSGPAPAGVITGSLLGEHRQPRGGTRLPGTAWNREITAGAARIADAAGTLAALAEIARARRTARRNPR